MLHGWVEPFIHQYGLWGLWLDVFLEAMGAPVPGETLLVVAAGLAANGLFDIRAVVLVALIGAVMGDNLGYLIGRTFGRPVVLAKGARFGITHERLARVEHALNARGVIVVVFARFVPLLRQLNGLAAGTAGMHWLRFVIANAIGGALWVGLWSWLAYGLGAHAELLSRFWAWIHPFAWLIVPFWIAVYIVGYMILRRQKRG
ncbi:hypothetical protein STA1M1_19860 [Sinisalibacter aestuarii]|uniref:VTT domain-containing protein n=2 Tax=Sinisalibacter aestuarii TaxID=2949426 RepID=A0ABQ5LVI2_9RHOB|nr:hypothetical protein STA1M1_19860 [Sinisalibacter aestuarii]